MTLPTKSVENGNSNIIETVIAKGDLSKLTPDERVRYYNETCRSLGLNPLTRPFEYITLNGQLRLYGNRACADQLRKIHGISIEIVSEELKDDLLTVHVRARDKNGRTDEDVGVVNFPSVLKGEIRANTIMKAITKAKRRVTMSISGLGFLDETEIEDIPRQNPHVIQPEDIVDVPAPDHPDRIVEAPAGLRPLRVSDQRKVYEKLIAEMHERKTVAALQEWKITVPERMAALSPKWREYMQTAFVGYVAEVRTKSDFLRSLEGAYSGCESEEELLAVDLEFSAQFDTVSVADRVAAHELREQHLGRIIGDGEA